MDVFSFRDRVVEDYGQFSRSFTQIKAPDLRDFVDGRYGDEEYWLSPLIQLNPSFVGGGSISDLVDKGLLDPECRQIFQWGKSPGPIKGSGQELQLHLHQLEALKIVLAGGCVILTTGTSSGKSISYILPMVQSIIAARRAGDTTKRIRAIVIYPMNALCNSQFKELEKYLCYGYPKGAEKVSFASYTGQDENAERERIQNNPPDILLTNYVMLEYILTRQNPLDQQIIRAAQGLEFLVLDELHTYRAGAVGGVLHKGGAGCRIRQEQKMPHQLPWACLLSLWAMAEEARIGRSAVISWVVLASSINSSTLALLPGVGTWRKGYGIE